MRQLRNPAAIGLLVLLPAMAWACSVPVFRFALDRWPADAYTVYVVHDGPLSAEDEVVVAALEKPGAANVRVRRLDVARKLNAREKAIVGQAGRELPRLVAEYPDPRENDLPAWTGPVNRDAVQALLDSPLRQKIARRIIDGQSAVWVLLECGDAAKDDRAAALLKEQLEAMPKTLKLPVPDDATAEEILSAPGRAAPRIEFSLVRLSRQAAGEQGLVSLLLHTEDDLPGFNEPLAFPVFGRGRALEALVGKGITAENIKSSCAFLVGACSCEVKRINPGRDLIMTVDWERAIGPGAEKSSKKTREKKAERTKEMSKPAPVTVPAEEVPDEDLAPLETATSGTRVAFYVLGGLVVVSLLVVLRLFR
jgi:hypothetical protein